MTHVKATPSFILSLAHYANKNQNNIDKSELVGSILSTDKILNSNFFKSANESEDSSGGRASSPWAAQGDGEEHRINSHKELFDSAKQLLNAGGHSISAEKLLLILSSYGALIDAGNPIDKTSLLGAIRQYDTRPGYGSRDIGESTDAGRKKPPAAVNPGSGPYMPQEQEEPETSFLIRNWGDDYAPWAEAEGFPLKMNVFETKDEPSVPTSSMKKK